jgi:hypothetical protein
LNDKKGLSLPEKEANLINNGKTLPFFVTALATGFWKFVFSLKLTHLSPVQDRIIHILDKRIAKIIRMLGESKLKVVIKLRELI